MFNKKVEILDNSLFLKEYDKTVQNQNSNNRIVNPELARRIKTFIQSSKYLKNERQPRNQTKENLLSVLHKKINTPMDINLVTFGLDDLLINLNNKEAEQTDKNQVNQSLIDLNTLLHDFHEDYQKQFQCNQTNKRDSGNKKDKNGEISANITREREFDIIIDKMLPLTTSFKKVSFLRVNKKRKT
jgi:hypothetical protein